MVAMDVHYGATTPLQRTGASKRKVSPVSVMAAAAVAACLLVVVVVLASDPKGGAETEKLLDARDEIKQLSNMIKKKVSGDQSFATHKTSPAAGGKKKAHTAPKKVKKSRAGSDSEFWSDEC